MNTILVSVLGWVGPALQGAMTLFVCVCGFLVIFGEMPIRRFASYAVRAVVIAYLLTGTQAYGQWVTTLFFTTIPNTIATVVTGSPTPITAAQQFDNVQLSAEQVIATAQGQATGLMHIGDKIALWWSEKEIVLILALQFFTFMLGRVLMAVVIVMGPFLLLFELFESTRGYARAWIGKLVGLTAFQLAATSLVMINSQGALQFVAAIQANPAAGLDQQMANIDHLSAWLLGNALAVMALPSIAAYGSGAAAGTAVASAFAIRAATAGGRAAVSGTKAMARALRNSVGRKKP